MDKLILFSVAPGTRGWKVIPALFLATIGNATILGIYALFISYGWKAVT